MKKQDNINFKQTSNTVTTVFSTSVAATAGKSNSNNTKLFSVADLWNLQRQRRSIVIR